MKDFPVFHIPNHYTNTEKYIIYNPKGDNLVHRFGVLMKT
jgi:hypothetical protein